MKIRKYKLQNILTNECFVVQNLIEAARITGLSCASLRIHKKNETSSKKGWIIKELSAGGEDAK